MKPSSHRTPFTIVVATGFSKPSQRAYDYALWLAGLLHARLCVLYVVMGAWPAGEHDPGARTLRPMKTAALLQLGRLSRRAFEMGIAADPHLEVGNAAERILDVCRKMRADLLVVARMVVAAWPGSCWEAWPRNSSARRLARSSR